MLAYKAISVICEFASYYVLGILFILTPLILFSLISKRPIFYMQLTASLHVLNASNTLEKYFKMFSEHTAMSTQVTCSIYQLLLPNL